MNKVLFTARLMQERDRFEQLLNRVGFARRLTIQGVSGKLSIKDMLADVLTREQFIADRMNEILHGEIYIPSTSHTALDKFHKTHGYPDYESVLLEKDKPNLLVTSKHQYIGVDEIVEQELAAYGNIISLLEKLTLGQCLDHDLFHRVAEHTFKTYRRTSLAINRWLIAIASITK